MATPLAKARGLGAAHRGTETFWRQRMTAIAIAIRLAKWIAWTVPGNLSNAAVRNAANWKPSSACAPGRMTRIGSGW